MGSEVLNIVIDERKQFDELEALVLTSRDKESARYTSNQKVFKNYLMETDPYHIGI